jgi:hypothetical protein
VFLGLFLIFGMRRYADDVYEHLYGCLSSIESYDMSKKGHIVYVSNKHTKEE